MLGLASPALGLGDGSGELFHDDFELGLDGWEVSDPAAIETIDSGDPEHGAVMRLSPAHARLQALIRGSETWAGYRVEGQVLFPTDEQNYLGFIYNYREADGRVDLGSLYIKGNGSYIRVNPRRDWNPSRRMYEEYKTPLTDDDAITIGRWQGFAAEVVGPACHFYVGDMTRPKVTFDFYEHSSGKVGFKPRVVGGPVWIDNVRVAAIDALSYSGARQPPGIAYDRGRMVTDWQVLGPLTRTFTEVEQAAAPQAVSVRDVGGPVTWRAFEADPRGAVLTARVTDFLGPRSVAYFLTVVEVGEDEKAAMRFSTTIAMAMWVNGRFEGYSEEDRYGWYDFGVNPDHPPSPYTEQPLEAGTNHVLIRVRGGIYATAGFYATVSRSKRPAAPVASPAG
jgi:hypothetical protein